MHQSRNLWSSTVGCSVCVCVCKTVEMHSHGAVALNHSFNTSSQWPRWGSPRTQWWWFHSAGCRAAWRPPWNAAPARRALWTDPRTPLCGPGGRSSSPGSLWIRARIESPSGWRLPTSLVISVKGHKGIGDSVVVLAYLGSAPVPRYVQRSPDRRSWRLAATVIQWVRLLSFDIRNTLPAIGWCSCRASRTHRYRWYHWRRCRTCLLSKLKKAIKIQHKSQGKQTEKCLALQVI